MEDQRLLLLVQQYPQLYDVRHEHYSNDLKKQNIWEEIGGKLGVSVDECQNRWTHILNNERARFEQEFEFLKVHTADAEQQVSNNVPDEARPEAIASEAVSQEVNTPPIAPILVQDANAQPIAPILVQEDANAQPIAPATAQNEANAEHTSSESESSEESSNEDPQSSRNRKSRKRKRCVCCTCSDSIRKYFLYKFQRLRERREKDELDHFFAHIEESVRYLPHMLQWDAKREISKIVSDLEYQMLTCRYDDDYELDE